MERHAETKPLLAILVVSCLLVVFPLVSSVPMPRSLRLGSQQQHPPALNLTSSQEMMAIAAAMNLGKPGAARMMDFEINDYPSPSANRHHGPGGPPHGRA